MTSADNLTIITIGVTVIGIFITFLIAYNIYGNLKGVKDTVKEEAKKIATREIALMEEKINEHVENEIAKVKSYTDGSVLYTMAVVHQRDNNLSEALRAYKVAKDSFSKSGSLVLIEICEEQIKILESKIV